MFRAVTVNGQVEPDGQRIDHRDANPVQAARDLVGIAVKLTARMQLGHDHFGRRPAFRGVLADRDTAAIIGDFS